MSERLELHHDDFFGTGWDLKELQGFAYRCIRRKAVLELQMRPRRAIVTVRHVDERDTAPVMLEGRWRSRRLAARAADTTPARLLAPLFVYANGVHLRHDALFTMGHAFRSSADYFMRNIFIALSANAPYAVLDDPGAPSPKESGAARLQLQYFYILRAMLPDPLLAARSSPETLDLIAANTFSALTRFSEPLVEGGLSAYRAKGRDAGSGAKGRLAECLAMRERVMAMTMAQ